jgi:hypothetical protein
MKARIACIVAVALLVAVGIAVQHQEVQYLVLPGGRRGRVRGPAQGGPVDVAQAFLQQVVTGVVDVHAVSFINSGFDW